MVGDSQDHVNGDPIINMRQQISITIPHKLIATTKSLPQGGSQLNLDFQNFSDNKSGYFLWNSDIKGATDVTLACHNCTNTLYAESSARAISLLLTVHFHRICFTFAQLSME